MSDFSEKFILAQKSKLLAEKERIANSFKSFAQETKQEGENHVTEDGDLAQKHLDQKLSISLREKDLHTLREIDIALRKVEDGSYGYCEETGEPIRQKRLEKRPWAKYSLEYAEQVEREQLRFNRRIS